MTMIWRNSIARGHALFSYLFNILRACVRMCVYLFIFIFILFCYHSSYSKCWTPDLFIQFGIHTIHSASMSIYIYTYIIIWVSHTKFDALSRSELWTSEYFKSKLRKRNIITISSTKETDQWIWKNDEGKKHNTRTFIYALILLRCRSTWKLSAFGSNYE